MEIKHIERAYSVKSRQLEWQVSNKNNVVIGSIDLRVVLESEEIYEKGVDEPYRKHLALGIEVKTGLKDLGQFLRQINLYRFYKKFDIFVRIAPPSKFDRIIKEQDIVVIDFKEIFGDFLWEP